MEQRAVATMPPVELLPVEQRAVETMLPVEETLAELGRGLEVSPPPPVKAVSSHVEKYYSAAGQAAATLLSIVVFQAYQAELLKELNEGEGITPEAVKELRQATDLVLRATKHTAQAVGHSMAGMVAVECHLWLNLWLNQRMPQFPRMDCLKIQSGHRNSNQPFSASIFHAGPGK